MPLPGVRPMMRLVLLTELIAPYRIPVFNALAAHPEINLHVIFLAETDPGLRQWPVYKSEIQFSYEVLPSWRTRVGKYNVLLNKGVNAALKRARPDALVCGGYNYAASWKALRWSKRSGVPLLLWMESTAHDLRSCNSLLESVKARFVRECDGIIVPGRSSYDYALSFGISSNRIFTAPNAVDVNLFRRKTEFARQNRAELSRRLGLPAQYFLFVGRLVREKGVFDLFDAYASLPPNSCCQVGLVFVGEGAAKPELSRRAASIPGASVQFPGFIQRDDLPAYYALADTFVFPTHTDPWGLVVNEAMSSGLPVICSSSAGCCADLVRDGRNGRVVAPRDVSQLHGALVESISNQGINVLRGECSRDVISQFTPESCARGLAEAALGQGAVCHG